MNLSVQAYPVVAGYSVFCNVNWKSVALVVELYAPFELLRENIPTKLVMRVTVLANKRTVITGFVNINT